MNSIPLYADWKASREYDRSFDVFKRMFPEVKEYQVFALDPDTKMSHIESEPLFETDDLSRAHGFIFEAFAQKGLELCIFQPRSDGYAGYYRKSNKHSTRDRAGRFVKA